MIRTMHNGIRRRRPATFDDPRIDLRIVLFVALLTRLSVVWFVLVHFPARWFYTRGVEMGLLANSLLDGEGLSSPFGGTTGPTAMIAPAYPIFVAGVFHLLGRSTLAASLAIMGIHIALNLVTIWMIMHLSRQVAGRGAAVMAGLFWACSLPTIWMPTIFWETSFSACLLLGFVVFARTLRVESTTLRWLGCGGYCGVAGLFNPALLPSLLMMAAWAGYAARRGRLLKPVSGAMMFILTFSAWPIRNALVFHAFIPTRTTVGFELWMGNHPGATGFLDESLFPMYNGAELRDYRRRGERDYTGHKAAMARAYVCAHPGTSARLTMLRVVRFWMGAGNRTGSIFFLLHAGLTTLLGAGGLCILRRSRARQMVPWFIIPMLLFPLPYYASHAEFRYRLVLDPLMCVLAACVLRCVMQRLSGMRAGFPAHAEAVPVGLRRICFGCS